MELSSYNIFSKESFSYISGNGNPEKILYISGNRTFLYFRKILIFQEVTFGTRKIKKTILKKVLIFREMELSSPKRN